jgi:hypothetical protein
MLAPTKLWALLEAGPVVKIFVILEGADEPARKDYSRQQNKGVFAFAIALT